VAEPTVEPVAIRTLDDLTHDELAVLGREYLLAGQLMDRAGMPHLIAAYGRDVMGAIAIDEWMGASPVYTRRMQQLLRFANGDVETIFKGMQFDIGAPPEFMDFRYDVIDANHGEFWLDHCGALMDVEPMGDEYVTTMCHAIEDPTFDATATATSHYARMRPLHRPPRVPAGRDPHCHWTVEINEEFERLPTPEPAEHIAATLLAALAIPDLATGTGDDGWNDYTATLDPDLQLEQFSAATLRALADEICVQQHLLVMSFLLAIERRYSTEDAVEVGAKQFTGIAGLTAERLRAAFGLGTTLADIAQVLELHPAFRPRNYVDFSLNLAAGEEGDAGGDTLTLRLGDCVALAEVGRDSWITILADGHDAALQATVQAINPCARVLREQPAEGSVASWSVTIGDEPAKESSEVGLTRFSTGADFRFAATPVTLSARLSTPPGR